MLESPKIKNLIKRHNIKYVFGVPRGGIIPAVLLSHMYNLEVTTELSELTERKDNLLIVDDIVDSGMTLKKYKDFDLYPNVFLSLLYKKNSTTKPDFYLKEAENDYWYVFPWETNESTQTKAQEKMYGLIDKAQYVEK